MHRFTHWLFSLPLLPRFVLLIFVFSLLSSALYLALRTNSTSTPTVNQITTCKARIDSISPSGECVEPGKYRDFNYVCASGTNGYLGGDGMYCLTLDEAVGEISRYCQADCIIR